MLSFDINYATHREEYPRLCKSLYQLSVEINKISLIIDNKTSRFSSSGLPSIVERDNQFLVHQEEQNLNPNVPQFLASERTSEVFQSPLVTENSSPRPSLLHPNLSELAESGSNTPTQKSKRSKSTDLIQGVKNFLKGEHFRKSSQNIYSEEDSGLQSQSGLAIGSELSNKSVSMPSPSVAGSNYSSSDRRSTPTPHQDLTTGVKHTISRSRVLNNNQRPSRIIASPDISRRHMNPNDLRNHCVHVRSKSSELTSFYGAGTTPTPINLPTLKVESLITNAQQISIDSDIEITDETTPRKESCYSDGSDHLENEFLTAQNSLTVDNKPVPFSEGRIKRPDHGALNQNTSIQPQQQDSIETPVKTSRTREKSGNGNFNEPSDREEKREAKGLRRTHAIRATNQWLTGELSNQVIGWKSIQVEELKSNSGSFGKLYTATWHGKKTVRIIDTTQSQKLLKRWEIEESMGNFKKSCTNWHNITHEGINLLNGFSATLEEIDPQMLAENKMKKKGKGRGKNSRSKYNSSNLATGQMQFNFDKSQIRSSNNLSSESATSDNTSSSNTPAQSPTLLKLSESQREIKSARDETISLLSTMLSHPNIKLVLVNEYLHHSVNLNQAIVTNLLEITPVKAAKQLANALGFLHDRKIIHQDIRGNNIHFVKYAKKQIVKISDSNIQGLIPLIPNRHTVEYKYSDMLEKSSVIAIQNQFISFPYEHLFYFAPEMFEWIEKKVDDPIYQKRITQSISASTETNPNLTSVSSISSTSLRSSLQTQTSQSTSVGFSQTNELSEGTAVRNKLIWTKMMEEKAHVSTDWYAFGTILYYMFTGYLPYKNMFKNDGIYPNAQTIIYQRLYTDSDLLLECDVSTGANPKSLKYKNVCMKGSAAEQTTYHRAAQEGTLKNLISPLWSKSPENRPVFSKIIEFLDKEIKSDAELAERDDTPTKLTDINGKPWNSLTMNPSSRSLTRNVSTPLRSFSRPEKF